MANFADNFQSLCDRFATIVEMVKSDLPFKKLPKKDILTKKIGVSKPALGHVFDFSQDIYEIRQIAERIELKLYKYEEELLSILNDMEEMATRLIKLRLEAPHTMTHPKKELETNESGPSARKQTSCKQPTETLSQRGDNKRFKHDS